MQIPMSTAKEKKPTCDKEMLKQYLNECMEEELKEKDGQGLKKLNKSIESFMK